MELKERICYYGWIKCICVKDFYKSKDSCLHKIGDIINILECNVPESKEYFIPLSEWRDQKIDEILND